MKIKGDLLNEASQVLGEANETEFTILILPVTTYQMIAAQAKEEGSTAARVFEKAVLQYLRLGDQSRNARGREESATCGRERRASG